MSIWNEHLCKLLGGKKRRTSKQGEFQCPLCSETVSVGELRAHAALDDQRFRAGLVIARIKEDHPEWMEADGACPKCLEYYRGIAGLGKIRSRPYRASQDSV